MSLRLKKEERYQYQYLLHYSPKLHFPSLFLPASLPFYLSESPIFASLSLAFYFSLAFSLSFSPPCSVSVKLSMVNEKPCGS